MMGRWELCSYTARSQSTFKITVMWFFSKPTPLTNKKKRTKECQETDWPVLVLTALWELQDKLHMNRVWYTSAFQSYVISWHPRSSQRLITTVDCITPDDLEQEDVTPQWLELHSLNFHLLVSWVFSNYSPGDSNIVFICKLLSRLERGFLFPSSLKVTKSLRG